MRERKIKNSLTLFFRHQNGTCAILLLNPHSIERRSSSCRTDRPVFLVLSSSLLWCCLPVAPLPPAQYPPTHPPPLPLAQVRRPRLPLSSLKLAARSHSMR